MRGLDHRPSIAQEAAAAAGVTMSFAFPPIHFRSLTQSAGGWGNKTRMGRTDGTVSKSN